VSRSHSSIEVRPIEPADKAELAAAFGRLSAESRYRRFFSPRGSLGERELRYFTEVDHHDHEALIAVDPGSGRCIGVARYVRLEDRPDTAELGVVVSDDRQGEGIGSLLLQRLAAAARANGIERLSALILEDNRPMLNLIKELGDVEVQGHEPGIVRLEVPLPAAGLGSSLRGMLRAAARGDLMTHPLRLARRLGAPE
jgi:RimJ/RimL family protein N-acetyltransferase